MFACSGSCCVCVCVCVCVCSSQGAGQSSLNFRVDYRQVTGPCKAMSIEYIQVFFEDLLQDAIASVSFAGLNANWKLGSVAALPYLKVSNGGVNHPCNRMPKPVVIVGLLQASFHAAFPAAWVRRSWWALCVCVCVCV